MRLCVECGSELATIARPHTLTCSPACRKRRSRRTLPRQLTARPRWVRYSKRKAPLTPDGLPASSTDPATWSTYTAARRSNAGVGLGLVLDGDGLVCIDLDHCLSANGLADWARGIVDRCPATYTEISPSGDGLHLWGFGNVPRGRRIQLPGGTAEVYGTGRFITVTGKRYGDAPTTFADLSEVIAHLIT
jgi:primase-polymerase (primpol)-like protein